MDKFEGKVDSVTGTGRMRGIGRATAMALAQGGADVTVTRTGRQPETFPDYEKSAGWRNIDSVAEEVTGLGRGALDLVVDVSKETQV